MLSKWKSSPLRGRCLCHVADHLLGPVQRSGVLARQTLCVGNVGFQNARSLGVELEGAPVHLDRIALGQA